MRGVGLTLDITHLEVSDILMDIFLSCRDEETGCGVDALISHTIYVMTYIYDPHMIFLHHELCRIWFSVCICNY